MEKNTLPRSEVLKTASMLASKYHGNLARLGNDQNQNSSHIGHNQNGLGSHDPLEANIETNSFNETYISLGEDSEVADRYVYVLKQTMAVEISHFTARRH